MRSALTSILAAGVLLGAEDRIEKVSAREDGAAVITFASGKHTAIRKERDQVGIGDAAVAPDRASAGWLVEYPWPTVSYPLTLTLIVWRRGKPMRRFDANQSFWSWGFYADGRQVAYHDGPLHGEQQSHCELHDVETGRLIAAWDGDLESAAERPAWTRVLKH